MFVNAIRSRAWHDTPPLARRLLAELLGSAFLAAIVIGSGIAAQTLSPGDAGLQLLENAAATAAGLFAIILMFGPVSGGHFNPVVSLVDAGFGGLRRRDALAYVPAQIAGCVLGAVARQRDVRAARRSASPPTTAPSRAHLLAEAIATAGLLLRDLLARAHRRTRAAPAAVGAYIGAAYFFTSSTSFANPAITVGRMFSDTFAGIAPASVPGVRRRAARRRRSRVVAIRALYPGLTPGRAPPSSSCPTAEPAALARWPPSCSSACRTPGARR